MCVCLLAVLIQGLGVCMSACSPDTGIGCVSACSPDIGIGCVSACSPDIGIGCVSACSPDIGIGCVSCLLALLIQGLLKISDGGNKGRGWKRETDRHTGRHTKRMREKSQTG